MICEAIKTFNADPIDYLPIEYVEECTNNFHDEAKLGEGGGGEVFLAKDKKNPGIQFVAKRIHNENIQDVKMDAFRRELEVYASSRRFDHHIYTLA
jgi:hypothetical protein